MYRNINPYNAATGYIRFNVFLMCAAPGYIPDSACVLYFVNKLSSEVSQSDECIQKYVIAYSNILSTVLKTITYIKMMYMAWSEFEIESF